MRTDFVDETDIDLCHRPDLSILTLLKMQIL